jgi:hypothetical protein
MTVKELIEELLKCDRDKELTFGDCYSISSVEEYENIVDIF